MLFEVKKILCPLSAEKKTHIYQSHVKLQPLPALSAPEKLSACSRQITAGGGWKIDIWWCHAWVQTQVGEVDKTCQFLSRSCAECRYFLRHFLCLFFAIILSTRPPDSDVEHQSTNRILEQPGCNIHCILRAMRQGL